MAWGRSSRLSETIRRRIPGGFLRTHGLPPRYEAVDRDGTTIAVSDDPVELVREVRRIARTRKTQGGTP